MFLDGHKLLTKTVVSTSPSCVMSTEMLSQGGFSLLCLVSPLSPKADLPQLSPLCDHKPWARFPYSPGVLPGLQQGPAGMRHHHTHCREQKWVSRGAGFRVMKLVSGC